MIHDWHTCREIASQPAIWSAWAQECAAKAQLVQTWISEKAIKRVWFTGAGTSAFIGDTLADALTARVDGLTFSAIPTTDLVSSPETYLSGPVDDLLVVSFGRSGNSSETLGTLRLLDKYAPGVHRLNITCNADSALARDKSQCILLPDTCHDQGFAMTSSFTTMLLTALACFLPEEEIGAQITALAKAAESALELPVDVPDVSRAVFLGSGPFKGIARESALKVLELTAGKIATSWDSALGFRHGPKAVMTDDTLVVIFLSQAAPTAQYDNDIAAEIRAQFPAAKVVTIGATRGDVQMDGSADDLWNTALFITYAQRLGTLWSAQMGLNVDNPFAGSGNLSRVVSHVKLYV